MNQEHYSDTTADFALKRMEGKIMNRLVKVVIPVRFPGLNEYIDAERANLHAGAALKKKWSNLASMYFKRYRPISGAVRVTFIWHEKEARRDKDNVAFAKKFIFDGMQQAGFLPNDNNKYVTGFSDEFIYGRGNEVEIIVTEMK